MNLDDREWKEFYIKELFPEIQRGKRLTQSKQVNGDIPYISSTSLNNGIDNFISNTKNVRKFNDCISIANSGSVGSSFYEPFEYVASDHVTHFKNEEMNKFIYLFIATLTNRLSEKYNFNREINDTRILKEKIILPINEHNNPDWIFVESYIKELILLKKTKSKKYIEEVLKKLKYKEIDTLSKKEWNEFLIDDLFNVIIGESIDGNKVDKVSGNSAYITRKESNNGLDGFIDYDDKELNNIFPVITIGNETAQPFVQMFPFFTGTKVNILIPKTKISDKALFFIVTSLRQQKMKYNYSYTINSTRLKKQHILLPITSTNEPDFGYMEQYIINLMIKKYSDYLLYSD